MNRINSILIIIRKYFFNIYRLYNNKIFILSINIIKLLLLK